MPQALKEQVYRAYGITSRLPGEYEIDHIISLQLGGSNSIRNLYPQSFRTEPLNSHVKDQLENRLHALACSGKITMQEAQQAISTDWTVAYVKYVGPLPGDPLKASVPSTAPVSPKVSALPPARTSGTSPAGVQPLPGGSCPVSVPVKISRAGLYHLPQGDGFYSRTRATQCFTDARSAAAGFRGIKRRQRQPHSFPPQSR